MNTDAFREFSSRLNLLYAGYFDALRATLFPGVRRREASAPAPTSAERQAQQRWENEGGA